MTNSLSADEFMLNFDSSRLAATKVNPGHRRRNRGGGQGAISPLAFQVFLLKSAFFLQSQNSKNETLPWTEEHKTTKIFSWGS